MKQIHVWLFICLCVARVASSQTNNPASTNQNIDITYSHSFEYDGIAGIAIWRGDVFVNDPQMTINCDILTAHFAAPPKTNAVPPAAGALAKVSETNPATTAKTNSEVGFGFGGKIESIVAESEGHRVVLVQKKDNSTATGTNAVYTAENDTVVMTGDPVVETPKFKTVAERIVYDRAHSKFFSMGPGHTFILSAAVGRTNLNSNLKAPKQAPPASTPGK